MSICDSTKESYLVFKSLSYLWIHSDFWKTVLGHDWIIRIKEQHCSAELYGSRKYITGLLGYPKHMEQYDRALQNYGLLPL